MAPVDPLAVQAPFFRGGERAGAFLPAVRRPERPEISMGGHTLAPMDVVETAVDLVAAELPSDLVFGLISAGFRLDFYLIRF